MPVKYTQKKGYFLEINAPFINFEYLRIIIVVDIKFNDFIMNVGKIMTKNPVTVPDSATLYKTAKILQDNNISGAPVVNEDSDLVGIVSEKDVFKALYPSHAEFYDSPGIWIDLDTLEESTKNAVDKPVQDFMTKEVITVNTNASLMQVGSMMMVRGIHRIVVVTQDNRIEGIVTRRDIYQNILKKRLRI